MDGAYWLNRSYVAQNLCENKNKPALHCDGKCYLSKQIKKDASNDATAPGGKREREETSVFLPAFYSSGIVAYAAETRPHIVFCEDVLPKHTPLLLRPPGLFTA